MAIVRPFKAIRPAEKYASKVISLPYDVMNREEAAQMADGNPYNFLHICRAEIDMPEQKNPYEKCVYERAKANIAQNLEDGVFVREEKPVLYLYKQVMEGRAQVGIVGCVAVDDYQNSVIKKHEFTRVEKEIDRINHFDVCNANTEPVFLTYRDNKKIRSLIEGWICNHDALFEISTNDGIHHTLWTVDDDSVIQNISELFGDIPSLYIADGHHRSASACKVGLKRREENPNYTGEEEFNYFMAVIFPDSDLRIFDYNRVVKDLYGNTVEEFLKKVEQAGFKVIEKGKELYAPSGKHVFSMYLEDKWYELKTKPEIVPNHVIDSLDVSILQNSLLKPILGIEDPRTDKRIDFVGGIRGLEELERRVQTDMQVAFAVYPVEIADLLAVSDNDMVMPPKSTWFEPKLGSGLFIHKL
jgi:uncharacterized protein (DUF1015 family)